MTVACSSPQPAAQQKPAQHAAPERKYLLERVDDVAIVQVYADGFESLPLREKALVWHLYQAAIAGRDIFYDQRHRNNLEMRRVLEAVVAHPQNIEPATLAEITRYTKLFWVNSGPYNNHSARKFVLKVSPQAFAAAVKTAVVNGASVPTAPGESLDAMLSRLQPMFFDPNVDPIVTNKTPGPGQDILRASANNLYAGGVTEADLKGFTEKHALNSRLVKKDGQLVEEVYRIGGRYSKEITIDVEDDRLPRALESARIHVDLDESVDRVHRLMDPKAFRAGIGRLLTEVQRIKSEGDAAAAATLFDTYGIHFDPTLRDEIVKRVDSLNLPASTAFVMPRLTPITDAAGTITDVKISYPQDFTAQNTLR